MNPFLFRVKNIGKKREIIVKGENNARLDIEKLYYIIILISYTSIDIELTT